MPLLERDITSVRETVLDRQRRSGEVATRAAVIPLLAGVSEVACSLDIAEADRAAEGRAVRVFIETSPDGGKTWRQIAWFLWISGPDSSATPTCSMPKERLEGLQVRMRVEVVSGRDCDLSAKVESRV